MSTHSFGYALSWEYWRRGMRWFVPALTGLTIGCLLVLSIHREPGFRWADVGANLREGMPYFVFWIGMILAMASWTALRRHYTLPVTTATLVSWSLVNGALAAAAVYVGTALVVNGALLAAWPVVIPALAAAAVYVAFQAVLWWLGPSRGVYFLAAVVLAVGLVVANELQWLPLSQFAAVETAWSWAQTTVGGFVVGITTVLLGYLAAVSGIARDRRGDAWSLQWLGLGWSAAVDAASRCSRRRGGPRFRSAAAAQFWVEWRSKGRLVPLSLAGLVCGLWWLCFFALSPEPYTISAALNSFTAMFVFLSPLVGVFLGSSANGFDMKSFAATRPLSDGGLASAVLRSAAVAVGVGAIVWLAAVMAMLAVWLPEEWQALRNSWNEGFLTFHRSYGDFVLMLVLVCWTFVGLGVSLALSRQWFVSWGGLISGGLAVSFAWSTLMLPKDATIVLVVLVAALGFGGTLAAFTAARRRRLVSNRTVLACLAGYLMLLAYLYGTQFVTGMPLVVQIVAVCLSATPFAPLAAAPLALSWNRHR